MQTKNEWEIVDGTFIYEINENDHNKFSASVSRGCFCDKCRKINPSVEEIKEITKLIASSPKMFKAIEQYIKHYDSNETNEEVKQWLDKEGIPMFREILK